MENEARSSKPDTRPAELPGDFGESDSPPETTGREESPEREDREAVPPDSRAEGASESKLERCEKTIHEHLQNEIEFSRAAREIITDRLYTEKGFESLGEYTKATFGIKQNQFRKYGYYARVFDIIEENREEIAEECSLTDVRDVPLPRVKAWTRPLHKKANRGLVEEVIKIWAAVVRRHGSSITGERVKRVREEVLGDGRDSEELEGENGSGESSSEDGGDSSDGGNEGDGSGNDDGSGDDDSGDDNLSEDPSGDDSDDGEGDEQGGFSVDLPSGTEMQDGATECGVSRAEPTKGDVEELAQKSEQKGEGLPGSSAEHMVASKIWKVLVPFSGGLGAGLPKEPSAKEEPAGVVLKPGRLNQITGLAQGHDGERVMVCPGVDLFAEVVPDGAIEAILDRCRKTDHQPVVFTRRLGRASDFDLSGLWVGTPADHSCLENKAQALSDAAPDAAVRWLLYDVEKKDRKDTPSFSVETDWVVYDPPGGAGVSLNVAETQSLVEAAEDSGADWSFRSAFKTCGDSGPSEEGAEVCSVEQSDEGSGPEDDPGGESGTV